MNKNIKTLTGIILILLLVVSSCKEKANPKEIIKIDNGFSEYVSGFTSGVISSKSAIRVRLNSDLAKDDEIGKEINNNLFSFKPALKGKSYWVDSRTIEFKPINNLESGSVYQVDFSLGKLVEVPEKFQVFQFQFQTIKLSFKVEDINIDPYSNKNLVKNKLSGKLRFSDYIENEDVAKILSAKQGEKELNIKWQHNYESRTHIFQIDSIQRVEETSFISLAWKNTISSSNQDGIEKIEIPGLNDFKVTKIEVVQEPEQHIIIKFSDPLATSQNLNGLIRIKGESDLKFIIEENQIKAFPKSRVNGTKSIIISTGIKNSFGFKLNKASKTEISFEAIKPGIQLIGTGVIVPNSDGIIFPFKAVNLSAIDVRIIKIYEDNIGQFLQTNDLNGSNQLQRVGRLILKKKVELQTENIIDFGQWNAFSFDLSDLIEIEAGVIYKVELGFRKAYSLYPCASKTVEINDDISSEVWDDEEDNELSYWDATENYYSYNDYYYYNYKERNNPCHEAYYNDSKRVSRNVLASNLGIIAKSGKEDKIHIAVTDLRTTKPLGNVEVEILNFQQQSIGKATTDSKGLCTIEYTNKPFLLIAKNNNDYGYLKLNDGTSLSLSKFDVSGSVIQKGVKGFLYGERGVWRPGDTLFLSFILEDKNNVLPEHHPVQFELINPNGQLTKRIVKSQSLNNFYNFKVTTDIDAPTGNWIGRVRVGGSVYEKTLKIESIKPNRLKIKLDFGKDLIYGHESKLEGDLQVTWLHGAVAKNLDAEINVELKKSRTKFQKYNDFIFDDPASKYYTEQFTVFDGKVNESGYAKINKPIGKQNNAPGMLTAVFTTRAFETSGDFSIDQFSIPFSPYNKYVGIKLPKGDKRRNMLLTDNKHEVEVVTVDAKGIPISVDNLEATVYKISWKWWWQNSSENLANYVGNRSQTIVETKKFSTKDGIGSFKFEIKYPDWGRYLVRVQVPNGHATGKTCYVDWPGWAGRPQKDNPGGASMLIFSSDKEKYLVGEDINITIPSSEGARALVSIESGSKVISSYWLETQENETFFKLKATEEMAPNVYINVTLVQPHAQTANDLPIRLYGVIPVLVEDPQTILEPELIMADELSPEKEVKIQVKEQNGKAMTYTIAIVDDGLLDLTRFKTPDPWSVFYAREALGIKTWDVYDNVLGAYGGKLEQLFAIGGDEELLGSGLKKANRFKPVVTYLGPFELKANKTNDHKFLMPKYIGSVRTMLIAGQNGAYGFAEKTTPVKNPLMILATLPRVLSPTEKVKLPVTVFALDEKIKSVELSLQTSDLIQVKGSKNQTVEFSETGDKIAYFELEIPERIGVALVKVKAKSGEFEAEYDIEIEVRNPNPPVVNTFSKIIQPGSTIAETIQAIGLKGTNNLVIETSTLPPLNLGKRLKYLIRYPHGCVEQTTSAVFPQLYLNKIMDIDKDMENKITENVKAGINSLVKFQLNDGGLGYWPNSDQSSEWGTNYAGHFILEAENLGYTLPINMKDNLLKYLRNKSNLWSETTQNRSDLIQAYRLYILALANEPELGAMNRLREMNNLSNAARWKLAAAYAIQGKNEVSKEIIAGLSTKYENDYVEMYNTYGSGLRDHAFILETLTLLKDFDAAVPVIEKISGELNSQQWLSTQTTAYCLMAMTKIAGDSKSTSTDMEFSYSFNMEKEEDIKKVGNIKQLTYDFKEMDSVAVTLTNKGESMMYVSAINEGIPVIGDQTTASQNMAFIVQYFDKNGNSINVSELTQGTDFIAEVTIRNTGLMGDFKEMALSQVFPSGWEIHNTRLFEVSTGKLGDTPNYQDIRDDRVYTYFDLKSGKQKKFVVLLNAAYLGRFYLPTAKCEAMYDNRINARQAGKWVEVIK